MTNTYYMGLDLSLSNTGIAIVSSDTFQPVYVDSVKTNPKWEHKDRLKQITDKFDHIINEYNIIEVAVENGFVQHNNTTKALFKVRGIAERWFHDCPQYFYAPNAVKGAIIHGQAKKELLRQKLEVEFPYIKFKNEDESDALAIIMCHLIKEGKIEWTKTLKQTFGENEGVEWLGSTK